jgi:hypothetical protein
MHIPIVLANILIIVNNQVLTSKVINVPTQASNSIRLSIKQATSGFNDLNDNEGNGIGIVFGWRRHNGRRRWWYNWHVEHLEVKLGDVRMGKQHTMVLDSKYSIILKGARGHGVCTQPWSILLPKPPYSPNCESHLQNHLKAASAAIQQELQGADTPDAHLGEQWKVQHEHHRQGEAQSQDHREPQ